MKHSRSIAAYGLASVQYDRHATMPGAGKGDIYRASPLQRHGCHHGLWNLVAWIDLRFTGTLWPDRSILGGKGMSR